MKPAIRGHFIPAEKGHSKPALTGPLDESLDLNDGTNVLVNALVSLTSSLGLGDEGDTSSRIFGAADEALVFDNSAAVRVDAGASLDEGLSLSEADEGQGRVEGSAELEDGLVMNASASAHITAMCKAIGAFDGLDV